MFKYTQKARALYWTCLQTLESLTFEAYPSALVFTDCKVWYARGTAELNLVCILPLAIPLLEMQSEIRAALRAGRVGSAGQRSFIHVTCIKIMRRALQTHTATYSLSISDKIYQPEAKMCMRRSSA